MVIKINCRLFYCTIIFLIQISRLPECQNVQSVAPSSVVASEYTRSLVDSSFRASSDVDFGLGIIFHIRLTRPITIEHVSERARGRPLDLGVFTIRILKHAKSLSSRCSVQLVPDEFKKNHRCENREDPETVFTPDRKIECTTAALFCQLFRQFSSFILSLPLSSNRRMHALP